MFGAYHTVSSPKVMLPLGLGRHRRKSRKTLPIGKIEIAAVEISALDTPISIGRYTAKTAKIHSPVVIAMIAARNCNNHRDYCSFVSP